MKSYLGYPQHYPASIVNAARVIENYPLNSNYPSVEKLLKLLINNDINASLRKIKEWLAKQEVEQNLQPVRNKTPGHTVGFKKKKK